LTSAEDKPSACVGLDIKSQLVYLGFPSNNTDIIGLADFHSHNTGMELGTSLGHDQKQARQVIEVYPFASRVRLFAAIMPQKTTKQGIAAGTD
jgi:hypothetical protein